MAEDSRSIHDILAEMVRHAIEQVNEAGSRSVIPGFRVRVEKDESFDAWIQGLDGGVLISVTSGMAMALLSASVALSCSREVTGLLGMQTAEPARPDMLRPTEFASIDAFRMPIIVPASGSPGGWEAVSELFLRALLFVVFHEQGHFVNGDLHYQRSRVGVSEEFREQYVAKNHASGGQGDRLRKAMEYRADMAASIHSIGPVGFLMSNVIVGRVSRLDAVTSAEWREHIIRGFAAIAVVQGVVGQLVKSANRWYPSPMLRGVMGFLTARDMVGVTGYQQFPAFYSTLLDYPSWIADAVEVTWRIMRLLGTPLSAEMMDGFLRCDPSNPIHREYEEIRPLLQEAAPILSPFAKAAQSELGKE